MAIDPDFLYELERFESEMKRQVNDIFQGETETKETGEGLIFADHRKYTPGDDTRRIDWNLYARSGEHYIKRFEEERNMTVHVLVDASGSMDYGEDEKNKFEYGAKIGLGYAYLTAAENNDFKFSQFVERPERVDSGASNRGEILSLIDFLNFSHPDGKADFGEALTEYASAIGSRSFIVIVSDFLGDIEGIKEGIDALSTNQLRLVNVLSSDELELPTRGDTIFEGIEIDFETRTFISNRTKSKYEKRLRNHLNEVEEHAKSRNADHVLVNTSKDFFDEFARAWVV